MSIVSPSMTEATPTTARSRSTGEIGGCGAVDGGCGTTSAGRGATLGAQPAITSNAERTRAALLSERTPHFRAAVVLTGFLSLYGLAASPTSGAASWVNRSNQAGVTGGAQA